MTLPFMTCIYVLRRWCIQMHIALRSSHPWSCLLRDEVTSGLKMLTIGPVLFVYESIEYDVK